MGKKLGIPVWWANLLLVLFLAAGLLIFFGYEMESKSMEWAGKCLLLFFGLLFGGTLTQRPNEEKGPPQSSIKPEDF